MSRRGVQIALADLERRGFIQRNERHHSGSTFYRLTFIEPEGAQTVRRGAVSAQGGNDCAGAQTVREGGALGAPRTLTEPKKEVALLRSDAPAIAGTSGQITAVPFDARKLVWTEGVSSLSAQSEGNSPVI